MKTSLLRYFCIFFFLTVQLKSQAQNKGAIKGLPVAVDQSPLTLKWASPQHRHLDKISLTFKEDTVELTTNTFSYQKGKVVRLGRFQAYTDSDLLFLKYEVESYYFYLKNTVSGSDLFSGLKIKLSSTPDMPILRINEEEIPNNHLFYKPVSKIIHRIWDKKWLCVECAVYKKTRKFIIRTTKQLKLNLKEEVGNKTNQNKKWRTNKQKFKRESLNCIPTGKKKVECIDSIFGAFEI